MAITLDTISKDFHSIVVEATDLDIRDLNSATDSVSAVQNGAWNVGITGNVTVDQGTSPWVIGDGGGSITVDAVNLDIRDLSSATDSIAAVQSGTWTVAVSGDVNVTQGTSPWVVSATDLDIRDIDYTQDNIAIMGATGNQLVVNADGSLNTQANEAGYSAWKVTAATVGASEVQLVSSPLSNRLRIEIQNLGNKDVWIKNVTGVSTSNGIKIAKGSSYEQALDAGANIFAISNGANADLRIAEYAA